MINTLDDPFLPEAALPRTHEVSSRVTLDYPDTGGHVGFVGGTPPGQTRWLALGAWGIKGLRASRSWPVYVTGSRIPDLRPMRQRCPQAVPGG
jgi:hypothetical protein